jgi:quinol monooxygenase YgiN
VSALELEASPVRMTLKWQVASGEAASITTALQTLMVRTRAEPGCTGCSLSTDLGARNEIRYVADWRTEVDLQRQIRSSDFARLAELMEHATAPPTVEFALPGGTRGLDYAEQVRRQNNTG